MTAEPINTGPALEIKITSLLDELVGFMTRWTALADRAGAHGFSRPEFCIPSWSEDARGYVWAAQAWRGDELVAFAPMWVSSVGPISVLNPIGTGPLARAEILCVPGHEDAIQQIVRDGAAAFNGVLVENAAAGATAASSGLPTRQLRSIGLRRLPTGDVPTAAATGTTAVDDADHYAAVDQRTDWYVPGAGRPTPFVLVQTVTDAALRAGTAVVIQDGWRGASVWLTGSSTVDLWCASGSCLPGGERWPAAVAEVTRWAAGRGLTTVRVPAHVYASDGSGASTADDRTAGAGQDVERRDVTVTASSTGRLWAATAAARRLESRWGAQR